MAPLDLVKGGSVLVQNRHSSRVDCPPPYGLVGGAEVGAKHEANLKEQVLCKDVREYACNIGMMFDLAEA